MIDYAPSFVRGDNVAMDVVIEDDRRPIIKIEREIEIERGWKWSYIHVSSRRPEGSTDTRVSDSCSASITCPPDTDHYLNDYADNEPAIPY